ncbi:MAG: hypothetical protein K6G10_02080 [Butyrivibrio sp.]|nr:hypothetical protein [Butyrivibrio sp.]
MDSIGNYNILALVSLVISLLLLTMAVVMWFKLDIRHYLAVLTGSEAKRSIDKIKKDAESGAVQADRSRRRNKAVISWNTSEGLMEKRGDANATVVLGTAGSATDYATVVLGQINEKTSEASADGSFILEKEIVNKETDLKAWH